MQTQQRPIDGQALWAATKFDEARWAAFCRQMDILVASGEFQYRHQAASAIRERMPEFATVRPPGAYPDAETIGYLVAAEEARRAGQGPGGEAGPVDHAAARRGLEADVQRILQLSGELPPATPMEAPAARAVAAQRALGLSGQEAATVQRMLELDAKFGDGTAPAKGAA